MMLSSSQSIYKWFSKKLTCIPLLIYLKDKLPVYRKSDHIGLQYGYRQRYEYYTMKQKPR